MIKSSQTAAPVPWSLLAIAGLFGILWETKSLYFGGTIMWLWPIVLEL